MNIESIAKTCHEVNRAYCRSLGDDSQPPWESAPDWQKESAVNGVKFHIAHSDLENPARASHENWMAEKQRTGWVYGPEKNPEAKTHPCMVPYEELPPEQRRKDDLFVAVVKTLAPALEEKPAVPATPKIHEETRHLIKGLRSFLEGLHSAAGHDHREVPFEYFDAIDIMLEATK